MRTLVTAAAFGIGTLALIVPTPSLAKLECKPGETLKCRDMGKALPPMCWCARSPSTGSGSAPGGKAEIKKRNVPTVKPNK